MKDNYKIYKNLAERNNWDFSIGEDNKPYFMKDNNLSIPDEFTSEDDKLLLASIISEGSEELLKLILNCWENNIEIAGPCSGIKEFHAKEPVIMRFGISSTPETVLSLYEELARIMPDSYHLVKIEDGKIKYVFNHLLRENTLTKDESNQVFKIINDTLNYILRMQKQIVLSR